LRFKCLEVQKLRSSEVEKFRSSEVENWLPGAGLLVVVVF